MVTKPHASAGTEPLEAVQAAIETPRKAAHCRTTSKQRALAFGELVFRDVLANGFNRYWAFSARTFAAFLLHFSPLGLFVSPSLSNKRLIPQLSCTDLTQSGRGKMAMTALFLVIGGVLGFRFKVLILIPAIILIVIVTASIEIAQRQDAWSSTLTTLAAVIAVQVGYLGGVAAGVVADHAATTTQKALDRPQLGLIEWFSRFIHP